MTKVCLVGQKISPGGQKLTKKLTIFKTNFSIFSKNHMVFQVSERLAGGGGLAGTFRFFHIFLYGSYKPKRQKSV